MDYVPFDQFYSYGKVREVVPESLDHARKLSTQVKGNIGRLKKDLRKKPLRDARYGIEVSAKEYSRWRQKAAGVKRSQEEYLKKLSSFCRDHKQMERSKKRTRPVRQVL